MATRSCILARLCRGGVLTLLALVVAGAAKAQPRDPTAFPQPNYIIKNNSPLVYSSGFSQPEQAKDFIEREHLSWPWTNTWGGGTVYCSATVPLFTKADFAAVRYPSTWSAETSYATIRRRRGQCLRWYGYLCTSFQCVLDPVVYRYMRADCPSTHVFTMRGGEPRCECPAGSNPERDATGQWGCVRACTPGIQSADCYQRDLTCAAGNPALPGSGAKVHTEVDYAGAGAHPLSFSRSYSSLGARPYVEPGAWSHWVHNWARRIDVYPEAGHAGRAYVVRDDASQRLYQNDGSGSWTALQTGDRNQLVEAIDAATGERVFQYRLWADDSVEHYGHDGKLLKVVRRNGWTATLTYSMVASSHSAGGQRRDKRTSVRNHFGRELRFTCDAAGRLAELLPPGAVSGTAPGSAASLIRYAYEEVASLGAGVTPAGQLTAVVWQDGHVRRYHYENAQYPRFLTGLTDELGVRIGTYTYNSAGMLVSSEEPGGINRIEFSYYGTSTHITDRSGATPTTSVIQLQSVGGVVRPVSTSAPCAQCAGTAASKAYTVTGEVSRSIGHDGRITFFTYDTKGRETERAVFGAAYNTATRRPALSLAESVTSTKWHGTWNLPTQVAEPGKVTAYTYGTGGRLTGESWTGTTDVTGAAKFAAVKTGSAYATSYGYNANVLPSTVIDRVDGIEARRWALAYNSGGFGDEADDNRDGRHFLRHAQHRGAA